MNEKDGGLSRPLPSWLSLACHSIWKMLFTARRQDIKNLQNGWHTKDYTCTWTCFQPARIQSGQWNKQSHTRTYTAQRHQAEKKRWSLWRRKWREIGRGGSQKAEWLTVKKENYPGGRPTAGPLSKLSSSRCVLPSCPLFLSLIPLPLPFLFMPMALLLLWLFGKYFA